MEEYAEEMDWTIQGVLVALENPSAAGETEESLRRKLEAFLYGGGEDEEIAEAYLSGLLASDNPKDRRFALSRLSGLEKMSERTFRETGKALTKHPEDKTFLEEQFGELVQHIFTELEQMGYLSLSVAGKQGGSDNVKDAEKA